jgi:gas vesicle protein
MVEIGTELRRAASGETRKFKSKLKEKVMASNKELQETIDEQTEYIEELEEELDKLRNAVAASAELLPDENEDDDEED